MILVSAQVESELMDLDEAEAAEYLADLGAKERGLHSLIRATYQQLGLRTYFTTGEKESRAWTIRQGMTAPQVGSSRSGGSVSFVGIPGPMARDPGILLQRCGIVSRAALRANSTHTHTH